MGQGSILEVEIRCHFGSQDEAYHVLPFLQRCLDGRTSTSWTARFFGLSLFKAGQLLRVGQVRQDGTVQRYLGWKGPDIGHFANIRAEIDEDFTNGITDSKILGQLGGTERALAANAVLEELDRLGHRQFMAFHGSDLAGYDADRGLNIKLMSCPVLRWPLLLELEKPARTEAEALQCEDELRKFSERYRLQGRLLRKEPPSLLYDQLYAH